MVWHHNEFIQVDSWKRRRQFAPCGLCDSSQIVQARLSLKNCAKERDPIPGRDRDEMRPGLSVIAFESKGTAMTPGTGALQRHLVFSN